MDCGAEEMPFCFLQLLPTEPLSYQLKLSNYFGPVCEGGMQENTSNMSSFDSQLTSSYIDQVATYTGVSQLEWREVETGKLPKARYALRAVTVDNIICVTGGYDESDKNLTSILSWDSSTESWQQAGNLAVRRYFHAAVAVPSSIIESECF